MALWKKDLDEKVKDAEGRPLPVVLLMVSASRPRFHTSTHVAIILQNKCDLTAASSIPTGALMQQFVADHKYCRRRAW